MKRLLFGGNPLRSVAAVLSAIAVLLTLAVLPASLVRAEDAALRAPETGRDRALTRAYEREQVWLARQQVHLEKANRVAARFQELIARAQGEGKDVGGLEAALATFNTQLAAAQSAHAAAAGLLSAHNGFDADGNVVDRDAALQTIIAARRSLRDAHQTLVHIVRDTHHALRDWRLAHRPTPKPEAETTPSS